MQFLYSAFFLAEASSKRFTYYYPCQTCYIPSPAQLPGEYIYLTDVLIVKMVKNSGIQLSHYYQQRIGGQIVI